MIIVEEMTSPEEINNILDKYVQLIPIDAENPLPVMINSKSKGELFHLSAIEQETVQQRFAVSHRLYDNGPLLDLFNYHQNPVRSDILYATVNWANQMGYLEKMKVTPKGIERLRNEFPSFKRNPEREQQCEVPEYGDELLDPIIRELKHEQLLDLKQSVEQLEKED